MNQAVDSHFPSEKDKWDFKSQSPYPWLKRNSLCSRDMSDQKFCIAKSTEEGQLAEQSLSVQTLLFPLSLEFPGPFTVSCQICYTCFRKAIICWEIRRDEIPVEKRYRYNSGGIIHLVHIDSLCENYEFGILRWVQYWIFLMCIILVWLLVCIGR